MSALSPAEMSKLSPAKRADVMELEIQYSFLLLEVNKEFDAMMSQAAGDIESVRRAAVQQDIRWRQVMQERDSKIRLIVERKENADR